MMKSYVFDVIDVNEAENRLNERLEYLQAKGLKITNVLCATVRKNSVDRLVYTILYEG